jgi:hypothetical protein
VFVGLDGLRKEVGEKKDSICPKSKGQMSQVKRISPSLSLRVVELQPRLGQARLL